LILHPLMAGLLAGIGIGVWTLHSRALDLGRSSSVLGYDAAQYAVAARELSDHGRLATPFALPIELARHPNPPWPLSLVQPGLVLVEALVLRLNAGLPNVDRPWWLLVVPLGCFLATAGWLANTTLLLLERHAPHLSPIERGAGAMAVGLAFVLDPEAQHYAAGGFTEMPFTLGLAIAVGLLARGAPGRPLAFGVLLGVVGLFRGNMLWLAPIIAACLAWTTPGRRVSAFGRTLLGYALVLLPWWIYKWVMFGNPAWDLSALSIWDGVGGRTWFSLNHLPELPEVPTGLEAVAALTRKLVGNIPTLLLALATGPRTLWIAALAVVALGGRRFGPRPEAEPNVTPPPVSQPAPVAAASAAVLLVLVASLLVAALTVPLLRYLAPARLVAEAAGLMATWAMLWRMPDEWMSPRARRVLCVALGALAVAWGVWQTGRGVREARMASADRGTPAASTLSSLASQLDARLLRGEPVMSNLGPVLAWYARRPVIHLALTPADVDACRRRTDFRLCLLAFRDAGHAWPGWSELMREPERATTNREWNIRSVRVEHTRDGFTLLWLDLGPVVVPMARRAVPAP
jgi:hypothetical protein